MALLTGSWLLDTLLLTATLLYLFYQHLVSAANYFKNRGIPYLTPNLLLGHLDVFRKSYTDQSRSLYNDFPGEGFFGYFQGREPMLVVKDLDLVQRIMVKDFSYFYDRGFRSVKSDLTAKNLFFLRGQTWRALRNKLLPTFSTGKLKLMFDQFNKSGEHLLEDIEKKFVSDEDVNVKAITLSFGAEVITSTAFGLDFSKDNPKTIELVSKISTVFVTGFRQAILGLLYMFTPGLMDLLGLSLFTPGVNEYFINLTKANKEFRKQNNIKRDDYFQLLLKLQESEEKYKNKFSSEDNNEDDKIINQMEFVPQSSTTKTENMLVTDEDVASQALGFIMGGTDSVSDIISFALYHMSKDEKIQKRAKDEVITVLTKNGEWSYQALKEMTYLDQIIQETMRIYPVLPFNYRKCTIPYQIPDSKTVLEKGITVAIPVGGIHMDPNYYPSPEVFDPERFVDNNYKPSPKYLPFGDGPRICIGMRFAILEMKMFLVKVLSKYSIELNNRTQEPIVFDPSSFSPRPVGGIWVNFKQDQTST